MSNIVKNYWEAKERYAEYGVDTDAALRQLETVPVSMQCWQGDDGLGFEVVKDGVNTGIMATGNYPYRARNADELRRDAEKAFSFIPGRHRFSLHSIYAETQGKAVERNELEGCYFETWMQWAKEQGIALDFNPTVYNHRMMKGGFSLSNSDEGVRRYWIEHVKRCRSIAAEIGRRQGSPCVNNLWISDGSKDICVDKIGLRRRLKESLDEIYSVKYGADVLIDSVESKLFGIGTESFVVGSLEFYLAYALQNGLSICFDMGHFHPTESVAEKLSAVFLYMDKVLLHVSRGVRWDSDHVVLFNDETRAVFQEIRRAEAYNKAIVAVDYFDASINRVFAWVIGMRAAIKGILNSFLEPTSMLLECENAGDLSRRLALIDELSSLPFGSVWDYYCESKGVPVGERWMDDVREYEKRVMSWRR